MYILVEKTSNYAGIKGGGQAQKIFLNIFLIMGGHEQS